MQLTYRPEIDGLRAIAVISVIIYHAKINLFGFDILTGGFLGVDIFFVISGYLITSIIYKEIKLTNNFSFSYFYERRIRRIIPALFFVFLICIPFAWLYILPEDLIDFCKSLLFSMGFTSNYFFYFSEQDYISKQSLYIPLLHTWSLSVEEQYYIIFPITFFIFYKFFKSKVFIFLISLFFLSFIYANLGSKYFPSLNFYSLLSRLWEIMAGSIISILYLSFNDENSPKKYGNSFTLSGVLLIIFSIIFYNDEVPHPSFFTLPVIIGTCMIIWFSSKNNLITKILSTKPFVGVGLISYSLYLWHYPIFSFSRIRYTGFISDSFYKEIVIIILLVVLSLFTFFFVEKPFRNKKNNFKFLIFPITIFVIFFIIFIWTSFVNRGFENRFYSNQNYKLSSLQYMKEFNDFADKYDNDNYQLNKKNVLIVGNSHAVNLLNILTQTSLVEDYYFNIVGPKERKGNNYQVRYFYEFLANNKALIDGNYKNFINHLKKQYNKSDIVILHALWNELDIETIDDINEFLIRDKKKLIVFDNSLYNTVKLSYLFNRLDYFVYTNQRLPNKDELIDIERILYTDLKNKRDTNQKIKKITSKNNIRLINMKNINCIVKEKRCPVITENGFKIYWDYGHYTREGARYFAEKFEKNVKLMNFLNFD